MKKTVGTTPRARAWALACELIPPVPGQADSVWNQGAREVVTGLLLHVQKTHPSLTLKQMARPAAALLAGDYHQIKVPSVTDALTTARSKGLRVILGIQSLAQIREVYTRETATVWAGQTASKIICQTTAPEDQKWCSDLLGERFEAATSENPEAAAFLVGGPDSEAVAGVLVSVGAALSPAALADL